nr:MAG TPA: LITAF-like protein [Caudoviricetes sp.]
MFIIRWCGIFKIRTLYSTMHRCSRCKTHTRLHISNNMV